MSQLDYEANAVSLKGNRESNQDSYTVLESEHSVLLALADGMGGYAQGEMAARLFTSTCESLFGEIEQPIRDPRTFLFSVMNEAHAAIVSYGHQQNPPTEPKTTALAALIQDGVAYWAHLGDSRLYLFRDSEPVNRTIDHSYVQQLHERGLITDEERAIHPQRNYITRCLGGSIPQLKIAFGGPAALRGDDIIMLCSDGLWSQFSEQDMGQLLNECNPIERATAILAHKAEALAFPDSDNVSVVTLRWLGEPGDLGFTGVDITYDEAESASRKKQSPEEVERALQELRDTLEHYNHEISGDRKP